MKRMIRVPAKEFACCHNAALLLVVALVATGCGRAKPTTLAVFPVAGRVLVNGVAPARAEIRMKPKIPFEDPLKRSVEPYAFVQDDGSFRIGTYSGDDGAPPGEYSLTMVWPVITVEGGEDVRGADRLKGKFGNPNSPIATFVVEESTNEIPLIELQLK